MIGVFPDKTPKCHMCGIGWTVLFAPDAKELAADPNEPPYWKCGVCGHVWPLSDAEKQEHGEAMQRARELGVAKAEHNRQKSAERRAAKTAEAVKAFGGATGSKPARRKRKAA